MKRLVEDFDDMMKIEDEVSVEDAKSPLEKELIRVYEYLKDKGETDIKEYEVAYQEAIEKIYPENLWWEVIDLNIFWDLFENQNPRATIDNIISSVKPEFKKDVIDTVVTEDVEEENPELGEPLEESKKVCEDTVKQGNKWVNKGKDGTHGTFKTKKAADAQRKAMFANKGKKSTFGESFEVGDTFTNAGVEWAVLYSLGDYSLVYSKDIKYQPYVVAYKLSDDGTWGQGHYFKDEKSAVTFLRNKIKPKKESIKVQPIKESDEDFVVFEQEPDDVQIDTDWFFDNDGIEYYIDGDSRDFADINKDFLDKEVDNEAIHKAFDDMNEDDEFYTVEDVFDYFDDGDIVDALSAGLGEEYESAVLRGYGQADWVTIYYPKRKYSRNDIRIIEDYYFGNILAWYNDDYGEVILTETELESYYGDPTKIIKKLISDATGVPVDKIKLRRFNGYHKVADYIDESKQRGRRNHRVTEAKQKRLSRNQRVKRIYESMKRKPNKNLKEAADDGIELFMNTWANYNEHGADGVITPTGWMSLDEAEEYADKYEEYEPFINDTENVPEELGVNEYSDISETIDMLRKYEDFDDAQKEVFAALIDDRYEVDKAFDIVDDNDYFYVKGDDDAELAENYIDELGGIESLNRDTLERYFDYGRYGRDLAFDFIKTDNGYVSRD